jgi:Bacteriocin-protection, YdeI or OmpD-Associated/Domain of unknown function (DUF1905)
MRFRTTVLQAGKTATGIVVPPEVVEGLGAGKRPAVRVTINGYAYRSTVATVDGKFMVGVSADVRERAGVAGGDTVDVDVELDTAPREVSVPEELAKVLRSDPKASAKFETLSNSAKQRLVLPIENAKKPETRDRNIDKAMAELRKE